MYTTLKAFATPSRQSTIIPPNFEKNFIWRRRRRDRETRFIRYAIEDRQNRVRRRGLRGGLNRGGGLKRNHYNWRHSTHIFRGLKTTKTEAKRTKDCGPKIRTKDEGSGCTTQATANDERPEQTVSRRIRANSWRTCRPYEGNERVECTDNSSTRPASAKGATVLGRRVSKDSPTPKILPVIRKIRDVRR